MRRLVLFGLALSLLLGVCFCHASEENAGASKMRGVWVATVYGLDYPEKTSTDPKVLKADADRVLDKCAELGFNTIFFQVRPASDAFYASKIFPYSRFLSGKQGKAPSGGFDPLAYWIEGAHSRGMELHAWINPYRVTLSADEGLDSLAENNPARLHPEYTFKYTNGNIYYNPAIPEVRQLILDGVKEIADNYAVDGIHMDDYFYPGKRLDDAADFEKYNDGAFTDIDDWRRNNCDLLVKALSDELRARKIKFGISPSGIWANKSENPLGSDTGGFQSYSEIFADTRKWAREGLIDYIAPQLYWAIGHATADYSKLLAWWCDTLKDSDTELYIGIAAYLAVTDNEDSVWYGGKAMREQLELNEKYAKTGGEIFYRYRMIAESETVSEFIKAYNGRAEAGAASNDSIAVYLNGKRLAFDTEPIIESGRTLVPLRAIFEGMGAKVDWNAESETVTALKGNTEIRLKIGENVFYKNGKAVSLDVPSRIQDSRTLVPLRAISEAFGADVNWDGAQRTVSIFFN